MSVSEQTTVSAHTGNGVTTVFSFSFYVSDREDLTATVAGEVIPESSYTVAGIGNSVGGSVTFDTAPASGAAVNLFRVTILKRETDYQTAGDFDAEVVNSDLDRTWLALQDMASGNITIGNTLRAPAGEALPAMPPAASRALRVLGFDADGNPVALVGFESDSAAALQIDLTSKTDAAKGGGQVYQDVRRAYASQSVGWHTQRAGVTPSMFVGAGAVDSTGVIDSTAALQAWASSALPKVGEPGTFKISGTLTFPANSRIEFRGMSLDASAGGTWAQNSVVLFQGLASAMPALSADVVKGQTNVTFASAHGLANGDVFCIYNPTDSSWSSIRTYYRAGEFCQAGYVTGASSVLLTNGLFDDYLAASVSVYKLAKTEVYASNLSIKGPTSAAVTVFKTQLCSKVRLDNVVVTGANYNGFYFDRSYNIETHGCDAYVPETSATDAYAMLIGNSQNVRIFGGQLYSKRGAFEVGGDDFVCAVPSRNVKIIGATMANDFASNFPACDLHGNLEGFKAIDCTIYGGGSWAGLDNEYVDCDFRDAPAGVGALIVGGSEWLGGTARVNGGRLRGTAIYSTSALVRIVTSTAAKQDTTLVVENVNVEMGANTTFCKTEMTTSAFKSNVKVEDITFSSAASLTQLLRCQGTGAAGDGNFIIVDGISSAPSGTVLYTAANSYGASTPARLMLQTGSAQVTMSTTNPTTSATPAYRYSYGSKVPNAGGATIDTRLIGTKVTTIHHRLRNSSNCTFDVGVSDNTNPTVASVVTITYSVGVNEV